jgi:hypothetical protein
MKEWNAEMLENWGQGWNQSILIVKNSFKPIIPLFQLGRGP